MSQKGVIFLKILISEFFGFFLEFILIFTNLIPLKKGQKGGFNLHRTRGADMAWHGTRADAT